MANSRDEIVIAVDFGTTFSGVAWATSWQQGNVLHIKRWPGAFATGFRPRLSDKVPTAIRYSGDEQPQWGFRIPYDAPSNEVLQHFKLKLDPSHRYDAFVGDNMRQYDEAKVGQLVADYLTALRSYLAQQLDNQLDRDRVNASQLHYVLAVPAIWRESAVQRTTQAFRRAFKLSPERAIQTVSEPAAAALCVVQRTDTQLLRQGECFMVLDAGGGTVDLISYVVVRLHPFEVKEAVPGSGDVCGSATVTNRFKAWLVSRLNNELNINDAILRTAVDYFDSNVKPAFNSAALASNQIFRVPVPGLYDNPQIGIFCEEMTMQARDINTMFQPSVERIKLLVAKQIAASSSPIATIILVGGYGQSQFLKEELEADQFIQQRGIRIHKSAEAWTAVVEGAVMSGLQSTAPWSVYANPGTMRVVARRARKHSGMELAIKYNAFTHATVREQRRWDALHGCYMVDVMSWFINKGDEVTKNKPHFEDFLMTSRISYGKPENFSLTMYMDEDSDVAPLVRNENVRELGKIEVDLSPVPEDQIKTVLGVDDFTYYSIEGQIEVVYRSADALYTLIYNGQRYNTVRMKFAF